MRAHRPLLFCVLLFALTALLGTALSGSAHAAAAPGIDASFVRPNHFAAIVIHPKQIAARPLVAEELKQAKIAAFIKQLGVSPDDVQELVILLSLTKSPYSNRPTIAPVIVGRFAQAVSARDVLAKIAKSAMPWRTEPITEVQVEGKTCYRVGTQQEPLAYQPAPTTVIMAETRDIARVITGSESHGLLAQRLKKASPAADFSIIAAIDDDQVAEVVQVFDEESRYAPDLMKNYFRLAAAARGGILNVDLGGPALLHATVDMDREETAGEMSSLLQGSIHMAKGGMALNVPSLPRDIRVKIAPLVKLANQCLDGSTVARQDRTVTLDVKRPAMFDKDGAAILRAIDSTLFDEAPRQAQQMNNMRQIALAMMQYETTNGEFPPAVIEKDGKPLLSWRVTILPYLGENELYKQFHLDEPWNSEHNLAVAKKMPAVYRSPGAPADGKTRVLLFTGKDAAFDGGKKISAAEIRDGMLNTILCVEAGPDKAVPWTKPEDLPFDPVKPLPALGKIPEEGLLAAMFDGSVQRIKVDNATLKALVTPAGNEVIDMDKIRAK